MLSLAKVAAQRDEKRNDYAHFRNRQELMNIVHVSLLCEKVNVFDHLELGHDVRHVGVIIDQITHGFHLRGILGQVSTRINDFSNLAQLLGIRLVGCRYDLGGACFPEVFVPLVCLAPR